MMDEDNPELAYTCPNCTSWYTGKESEVIDISEFGDTSPSGFQYIDYYCPHCSKERDTEVLLMFADNYHILNPYQVSRVAMIKGMIEGYQDKIDMLEEEYHNLTGERP